MGESLSIDQVVDRFLEYRRSAGNNSPHTLNAYGADLSRVAGFLHEKGIAGLEDVQISTLRAYFSSLQSRDYARTTLSRKQASLRALFRWAQRTGLPPMDPTRRLRA